ncbi:MAG: hypothetical protein IJY99_00735 [Alphaproteobacteria bacterium]|nr:hypothetical protein [Alphaproteobacteria bacterium]
MHSLLIGDSIIAKAAGTQIVTITAVNQRLLLRSNSAQSAFSESGK